MTDIRIDFGTKFNKNYQKLAAGLLSHVSEDGKQNALCSPMSLQMLIGMLLLATGGNTREEAVKAFGFSKEYEDLVTLISQMQSSYVTEEYGVKNTSSNALITSEDMKEKVSGEFLKKSEQLFGAEAFYNSGDMETLINSWVNEKTDGMIQKMIDKVPDDMKLCLINALTFQAPWMDEYEEDDVEEDCDFTNADGTISKVTMLHSREDSYIETPDFTGFSKSYSGGRFAYMVLLPKKHNNPKFLRKALDKLNFAEAFMNTVPGTAVVTMPEFTLDTGTELKDFFRSLGITKVFEPGADFSGIAPTEDLMADSVLQKCRIEVSRFGTKAAAATAMIAVAGCCPDFSSIHYVDVNRPFVYAIMDTENMVPVFTGLITQFPEN